MQCPRLWPAAANLKMRTFRQNFYMDSETGTRYITKVHQICSVNNKLIAVGKKVDFGTHGLFSFLLPWKLTI